MRERLNMPKLFGVIVSALIVAGCTDRPVDPIVAEKVELHAQVEAMKNHPSLVEREKNSSPDSPGARK